MNSGATMRYSNFRKDESSGEAFFIGRKIMIDIPVEKMLEFLSYNPDTGELSWKKRKHRSKVKSGYIIVDKDKNGYLKFRFDGSTYKVHRVAYAMAYNKQPQNDIDHINGVKWDNRISNLREATKNQNMYNIGIISSNSSGHRGVSWCNRDKRFRATITINNKYIGLGYFKTAIAASNAYEKAAREAHGEFYREPEYVKTEFF